VELKSKEKAYSQALSLLLQAYEAKSRQVKVMKKQPSSDQKMPMLRRATTIFRGKTSSKNVSSDSLTALASSASTIPDVDHSAEREKLKEERAVIEATKKRLKAAEEKLMQKEVALRTKLDEKEAEMNKRLEQREAEAEKRIQQMEKEAKLRIDQREEEMQKQLGEKQVQGDLQMRERNAQLEAKLTKQASDAQEELERRQKILAEKMARKDAEAKEKEARMLAEFQERLEEKDVEIAELNLEVETLSDRFTKAVAVAKELRAHVDVSKKENARLSTALDDGELEREMELMELRKQLADCRETIAVLKGVTVAPDGAVGTCKECGQQGTDPFCAECGAVLDFGQ